MYLVTREEMKQYDKNTIEQYHIPSMVLMERAALSVCSEIKIRFSPECGKILVLCGAGNNGGDGFAIARILHLAGYKVEILFAMKEASMTPEARAQCNTAKRYGVPVFVHLKEEPYAVIVDALFGIGLSRTIEGTLKELLDDINSRASFRIAVDISSGVSADTGEILGAAFCADLTVTFAFAKVGQLLYPGAEYTGELLISDIGIEKNSFLGKPPLGTYLGKDEMKALLPARKPYSNKGSYGKALIVAGSPAMAGAAYFAAKAAYYSGCGLVRVFTAAENREILLTKLPEAIITAYSGQDEKEAARLLKEGIQWADAVLIGPGISQSRMAERLLEETLSYPAKKIVFDADALNLISRKKDALKQSDGEWVVTPHLGEMSRLTGEDIAAIQKQLLPSALALAGKYRLTCVLKDARTVIGLPDGTFFINTTGNHGMATGGSGDVLAGLLTGFLAQGMSVKDASALAVCLHGTAGDLAKEEIGARGMIATDLLEHIPLAIKNGEENESA